MRGVYLCIESRGDAVGGGEGEPLVLGSHCTVGHSASRSPATNSKSKRVRAIPLNDHAIEVLDRLGTEGKSAHLFINLKTGERLTAVNKVWGRLRVKAGLPHLRLHDLRHQFASFLVNAGHTIYEVQKILGHSDKVTERYAHLSLKTLEKASGSASNALMGAGRGVVVPEDLEAA
ncbi:site-specific integrase [Burkholderia sp. LMU1-1-1.1]|uniref:site-specific integrase n=1 Tax=Burkholderia sp. LMU1-1-1.1 TaxID=3135266 RepID=UPI00342D046C